MIEKRPRLKSDKHRRFVAWHVCVVHARGELIEQIGGHDRALSQCAHVKYLAAKHGRAHGMSIRDDVFVVPLCPQCHDEQTGAGNSGLAEIEWWLCKSIDPEPICRQLAEQSPDPKVRAAIAQLKEKAA